LKVLISAAIMSDHPGPEIQISEEKVHKFGLILAGLALLFTVIGAMVSPLDDQGQPVLLLPEVKAIEAYRQTARGWIVEMNLLDGEIAGVISPDQAGDLFSRSRGAQQTLERAVDLMQRVDRAQVPPIGMGLHEQMRQTAQVYLEAARDALQWISAPNEENKDLTCQTLEQARQMKTTLEKNTWLISP
jgi:hypothetical protein